MSSSSYIFIFICIFYLLTLTHQHGRLMEPPGRNVMWRVGFKTPPNYEDSELFCGGLKVQWETNGGKCGVCGDSYSGPRNHETGGYMARNITARTYAPNTTIDAVIDIVANHAGFWTFQLCWRSFFDEKETENCFEELKLLDGSNSFPIKSLRTGIFIIPVKLPPNRTCEKCIFRWNWKSGNNWGVCENGTQAVGCGPQEVYRNCADVRVMHETGIRGPLTNFIEELK